MDWVGANAVAADVALELSLETVSLTLPGAGLSLELRPAITPELQLQLQPAPPPEAQAEPQAGGELPAAGTWERVVHPLLVAYVTLRDEIGAPTAASALFGRPPHLSEHPRVSAAIGALAIHLGLADGWPLPDWARRVVYETGEALRVGGPWWFVAPRRGLHASALMQSPAVFRRVRVFVTTTELVPQALRSDSEFIP